MKELARPSESTDGLIPSIRMGQMDLAQGGKPLRTLLGSCVGVALYDRAWRIGGLAHIVLPRSNGTTDFPGKFVDTAVPLLVEKLHQLSGTQLRLVAKLAGGATMFASSGATNIGQQNIQATIDILKDLRIPLIAQHCGGEKGRRVTLDTSNGFLRIEIVGDQAIEI